MKYKYKLNQKKSDLEVTSHIWDAYQEGLSHRQESLDGKITTWKKAFNKELYGGESNSRSKIVDATVKNYSNTVVTNIIEPLVNTHDLIRITSNKVEDSTISKAKMTEDLINYQFTKKLPRFKLLNESVKLFVQEGIVVSKLYWDFKVKEILADNAWEDGKKAEYKNLSPSEFEELVNIHSENKETPVDVDYREDKYGDTSINVNFIYRDLIKEQPMYENIPIENIVYAPSTTQLSYTNYDCDYVIEQRVVSSSEVRVMLKEPGYKKIGSEALDQLLATNVSNTDSESSISALRSEMSRHQKSYLDLIRRNDPTNKHNIHVLLDFWGKMDIDNDGIEEDVHILILNDKILKIEMNPYLNNMIPYNIAMFDQYPFMMNGDSIPEFLLDVQKMRTAIQRNMLDSLAYGTLQNYIIEEGTFSAANKKRFLNRAPGDAIEAKSIRGKALAESIINVKSEQIKQEFFTMYNLLEQQAQENSGVTAYTQGLDSNSLNQTATGVSIVTQNSMKKLWNYTTTFIESHIKPMVEGFIILNKMYLSDVQFKNILGEIVRVSPSEIDEDADVAINVAIKGFDGEKANQIIQFMNLTAPMVETGIVSTEAMSLLVKELAEIWELKSVVNSIGQNKANMGSGGPNPNIMQGGQPMSDLNASSVDNMNNMQQNNIGNMQQANINPMGASL